MQRNIIIKDLGKCPYTLVVQKMRDFIEQRISQDPINQLWLTEHEPVFTQGQAGKAEHMLKPTSIPVIQSDRGGQITYHGPGQLIFYPLLHLPSLGLNIRQYISALEQSVIAVLREYAIPANSTPLAPGVYIFEKKVAAIGIRVRKGYSYHGMSVNINVDLTPFANINPCGYPNLEVINLNEIIPDLDFNEIKHKLTQSLLLHLGNFND